MAIPALLAPALAAAILLVVAGAQKAVDPTMTVGALRGMGWPSSPRLVRAGSVAELAIGASAIVLGGAVPWGLVAVSYFGFAAFVAAALRAGALVGTCGCFGREDTPPHVSHVVLDLGLGSVAAVMAITSSVGAIDAIAEAPLRGAVVLALSLLGTTLLYGGFVLMPRTLTMARPER